MVSVSCVKCISCKSWVNVLQHEMTIEIVAHIVVILLHPSACVLSFSFLSRRKFSHNFDSVPNLHPNWKEEGWGLSVLWILTLCTLIAQKQLLANFSSILWGEGEQIFWQKYFALSNSYAALIWIDEIHFQI